VKILLFGSTGKVGSLVLRLALKRGFEVVCFEGDVRVKSDVENFFSQHHNADVVISTLGSWGTKTKDILSCGMTNIIPAMKQHTIRRIISLTGAETRLADDQPTWSSRVLEIVLKIIAPKVYHDGQQHLEMLRDSQLIWTVIRSPKMNNGSSSHYHLSTHCPHAWQQVTRKAVATAIVESILSIPKMHSPFIASR
jgi:putative NADH-flavin reductase